MRDFDERSAGIQNAPATVSNPIGRRALIGWLAAIATVPLAIAGCQTQPRPDDPDELPEWSAFRIRRGSRHR